MCGEFVWSFWPAAPAKLVLTPNHRASRSPFPQTIVTFQHNLSLHCFAFASVRLKCANKLRLQASPSQTIATFERKISQHWWTQHIERVWPTRLWGVAMCCNLLGAVVTSLQMVHFMHHSWMSYDIVLVWPGSRNSCARACTLVRFEKPNMSEQVATGFPMLRSLGWRL